MPRRRGYRNQSVAGFSRGTGRVQQAGGCSNVTDGTFWCPTHTKHRDGRTTATGNASPARSSPSPTASCSSGARNDMTFVWVFEAKRLFPDGGRAVPGVAKAEDDLVEHLRLDLEGRAWRAVRSF